MLYIRNFAHSPFLFGYLPGKRNDQPKSGIFGCVCGVYAAAEPEEHIDLIPHVRLTVVHIEGEQRAAEHVAVFCADLLSNPLLLRPSVRPEIIPLLLQESDKTIWVTGRNNTHYTRSYPPV